MLVPLDDEFVEELSAGLRLLSKLDRFYFSPHEFDPNSIRKLLLEQGNYFYIYLNERNEPIGYGMLRTFGKYEVPTLGCVIWPPYRGCGNGIKLVQELISKAMQLKYKKIKLKYHPDNTAAGATYRRAGFREIGKAENGQIWMEYGAADAGRA